MKFWIFLVIGFWNLSAQSQVDINAPLQECHIDSELIKKYNIQSLTIFSDQNENGIDGTSTDSGKLREYEFDQNGNTLYQLTASNGGNGLFLYYDKGSRPEYSTYDEQGLLINLCRENLREINESSYEYDADGNVTMEGFSMNASNLHVQYKQSYEWIEGKMVNSIDLIDSESDFDDELLFDEKGRISESSYSNSMANYRTTYEYREIEDTLTSIQTSYRNDTLFSIYSSSYLRPFKHRIVHNSKRDHNGDLVNELNVKYDEHHNAIHYHFVDWKEVYGNEGTRFREPILVEIINEYDDRGFLVKQLFHQTYSYRPEKILNQVNRFIYETTPLVFKIKKGAISKNALEEKEFSRDY